MTLLSGSNYYSNSFEGRPKIGSGDINIYETGTNPKYAVGYGFERADGSKFRYVQYGGTVVAGNCVVPDTTSCLVKDVDNKVTSSTTITLSGHRILPNYKGSPYVQMSTTTAFNSFAGGYLIVTDGTGIGYTHRIKGNSGATATTGAPTAANIIIELYEPLNVNLDASTDVCLRGSLWADVIQTDASAQYRYTTGIACANGTDGKYGWVCTKGITAATQAATLPSIAGMGCIVSSATAGAVQYANNFNWATLANFQVVGTYLDIGDSAGCSAIYVNIE